MLSHSFLNIKDPSTFIILCISFWNVKIQILKIGKFDILKQFCVRLSHNIILFLYSKVFLSSSFLKPKYMAPFHLFFVVTYTKSSKWWNITKTLTHLIGNSWRWQWSHLIFTLSGTILLLDVRFFLSWFSLFFVLRYLVFFFFGFCRRFVFWLFWIL